MQVMKLRITCMELQGVRTTIYLEFAANTNCSRYTSSKVLSAECCIGYSNLEEKILMSRGPPWEEKKMNDMKLRKLRQQFSNEQPRCQYFILYPYPDSL